MYDGHPEGFCVDVYAEVFPYVESYENVEVYDENQAGFFVDMYVYVCALSSGTCVQDQRKRSCFSFIELYVVI